MALALTLAELIRRSSQVEEIYFSGWEGEGRVGDLGQVWIGLE
jgi:hypothetical protein